MQSLSRYPASREYSIITLTSCDSTEGLPFQRDISCLYQVFLLCFVNNTDFTKPQPTKSLRYFVFFSFPTNKILWFKNSCITKHTWLVTTRCIFYLETAENEKDFMSTMDHIDALYFFQSGPITFDKDFIRTMGQIDTLFLPHGMYIIPWDIVMVGCHSIPVNN